MGESITYELLNNSNQAAREAEERPRLKSTAGRWNRRRPEQRAAWRRRPSTRARHRRRRLLPEWDEEVYLKSLDYLLFRNVVFLPSLADGHNCHPPTICQHGLSREALNYPRHLSFKVYIKSRQTHSIF